MALFFSKVILKNCQKCKKDLPLSSFPNSKDTKDGHGRWCSRCFSFNNIRRAYNITLEEYEEKLREQNSRCAICDIHHDDVKNKRLRYFKLCVDHDHNTGKTRGLLCPHCNLMLGQANDNIERLQEAIEYLKYHKE